MTATSFFYKNYEGNLRTESGGAAKPMASSAQPHLENPGDMISDPAGGVQNVVAGESGTTLTASTDHIIKAENAAERQIVHPPIREVQHLAAGKMGTIQAKDNDPVELWRAVRRGSVSAEVALAELYLEGVAVPQSCEQAHMLLHAASAKGSKVADNVLKNSYGERCEQSQRIRSEFPSG